MRNNIPNLFIIGAPKSGTTGLVSSLKEHPDIFVPDQKEPRFFDAHTFYDYVEDYPLKNINDYLSLYANNKAQQSQYRVDGSVFNMYSEDSIKAILEMSPDAKFIVILRYPLSATKSMYLQRMKYINPALREISEDFNECWRLSKDRHNGKNYPKDCRNKFIFSYDLLFSYEKYLPYLEKMIPEKNLHIVGYTHFTKNSDSFYKEMLNFLSLDDSFKLENKKENSSYLLKKNTFTTLFGLLTQTTLPIRKKMGLHGKSVEKLRNLLIGKYKEKIHINSESDEDIKEVFRATYQYLEEKNIKL